MPPITAASSTARHVVRRFPSHVVRWSEGKKQNLSLFFFLFFFSLVSGRRLARSSLLSCICTMLRGVEAGVTAPRRIRIQIPE